MRNSEEFNNGVKAVEDKMQAILTRTRDLEKYATTDGTKTATKANLRTLTFLVDFCQELRGVKEKAALPAPRTAYEAVIHAGDRALAKLLEGGRDIAALMAALITLREAVGAAPQLSTFRETVEQVRGTEGILPDVLDAVLLELEA